MSWRQVKTLEGVEEFAELLRTSHSAYANETAKSLADNTLSRPNAEMWIYDGPTFKIPLSLAVVKDHIRVFTGIPSGDFSMQDQPRTSKIVIRKMRDYQDRYNESLPEEKQIHRLTLETLKDYGDESLNDYCLNKPAELMHEHEPAKDRDRVGGQYKRQEFYRDPTKKKDDEKFQGRQKRRVR